MVTFTFTAMGILMALLMALGAIAGDNSSKSKEDQAYDEVQDIVKNSSLSKCDKCTNGLAVGKKWARSDPDIVPNVLMRLCKDDGYSGAFSSCNVTFAGNTTEYSAMGVDVANVLTLIDPHGVDGKYICNYKFNGACSKPDTPDLDVSSWWSDKPSDAVEPKTSGETFNVIHVSDVHVELTFKEGAEVNCSQSMCCSSLSYNSHSPNQVLDPATRWGGYSCDSPELLIENALQSIGKVTDGTEFDFALFTGDMIDHGNDKDRSLNDTIDAEETAYRQFKDNLNGIPVYITLGNHDTFPYGQNAQQSSGFYDRYKWNYDLAADLWADKYHWIDDPEAVKEIKSSYASFSLTTKRGLRIISLDSNFWYKDNYYNFWNMSSPDTSGLFKFLADELSECEKNNQRAWIITHVPTGGATSDVLPGPSKVFNQIVERFSPHVIAAIFFGHTHEDQFQLFYAGDGKNSSKTAENVFQVAYLGQSITPFKQLNPGWRYYKVDSKTFSIMDSVNYYMPLDDAINHADQDPQWKLGYTARDQYDPDSKWPSDAPLNATFWHNVAHSIYSDQDTRDAYVKNEMRNSPYVKKCTDDSCRHDLFCKLTSGTIDQLNTCKSEK
uniref:ARAD1B10890p n=1 Tax=Blastobotrys adeninivorans TaxID=409370 RepID=A0A060TAX3_BLAAD